MVYSAAFAAVASDIHDTKFLLVEPAEVNGSKVNRPEAFPDLLEAVGFEAEKVRNEDFPVLSADGLGLGDLPKLEMRGVGNVPHATGERPNGGSIDGAGGFELESFMGPLFVEDAPEGVGAPLLGAKVLGGRAGGFGLEGAMHAFVPPILMGAVGLNEFGTDSKLDPVNRHCLRSSLRMCCRLPFRGVGWRCLRQRPGRELLR